MAELVEGTYVIISVGSQKAIDVKGGSDKSGVNVQQHTITKKDPQIWAATKPNDNDSWQFICSLTGKSLDVEQGRIASGTNVRQWNDNNSDAQRWSITDDGQTFVYNGKTYTTYTISPYTDSSLTLDVEGGSGADAANIRLWRQNHTDAQRWFFLPVSVLTEEGAYEIVLASDPKMCMDITSAATTAGANVQVWTRNGSDAQIFRASIDPQTFLVKLYPAVAPTMCLDIANGKAESGTNVQQWRDNGSEAQNWLPVQKKSVKVDGQTLPTYELHAQKGSNLVMDCQGGGTKARTNIQIWKSNSSDAQRFAFVKTERLAKNLTIPGGINETTFTREGPGSIRVNGLTFDSRQKKFQARYKLTYSTFDGSSASNSKWMNVGDDSTSNEGWGDAWTPTFTISSNTTGIVDIPFDKTFTLNTDKKSMLDITFEIRVFTDSYEGYAAHSAACISTVRVSQLPVFTLTSMKLNVDTSSNVIITSVLHDSRGFGCERLRARLIDSSHSAISSYVTTTTMTTKHSTDGILYRLPNEGEEIGFDFTAITVDGLVITDIIWKTFTYGNGGVQLTPQITYLTDDSYCIKVECTSYPVEYCLMEVPDVNGKMQLKSCYELKTASTGMRAWKCAPPLNRDIRIVLLAKASKAEGIAWGYGTETIRMTSHMCIWNWSEAGALEPYENSVNVYLNVEKPPLQTRVYQSDVSLFNTTGRNLPIAYSGSTVSVDLSLEAVVIDPDADIYVIEPLPSYATVEDLSKLMRLSGRGIHPTYRSPYGDWFTTVIESVDATKEAIGYSKAKITQHAVED